MDGGSPRDKAMRGLPPRILNSAYRFSGSVPPTSPQDIYSPKPLSRYPQPPPGQPGQLGGRALKTWESLREPEVVMPNNRKVHVQSIAKAWGRERLAEDVVNLKNQLHEADDREQKLLVCKRRLEAEVHALQSNLNKAEEILHKKTCTSSPNKVLTCFNQSPEQTSLVRSLKIQNKELMQTRNELEAELIKLNKSARMTRINELESQNLISQDEIVHQKAISEFLFHRLWEAEKATDAAAEIAARVARNMDTSSAAETPSSKKGLNKTMEALQNAHQVLIQQANALKARIPAGSTFEQLEGSKGSIGRTANAPVQILKYLRAHLSRMESTLLGLPGGQTDLGRMEIRPKSKSQVSARKAKRKPDIVKTIKVQVSEVLASLENGGMSEAASSQIQKLMDVLEILRLQISQIVSGKHREASIITGRPASTPAAAGHMEGEKHPLFGHSSDDKGKPLTDNPVIVIPTVLADDKTSTQDGDPLDTAINNADFEMEVGTDYLEPEITAHCLEPVQDSGQTANHHGDEPHSELNGNENIQQKDVPADNSTEQPANISGQFNGALCEPRVSLLEDSPEQAAADCLEEHEFDTEIRKPVLVERENSTPGGGPLQDIMTALPEEKNISVSDDYEDDIVAYDEDEEFEDFAEVIEEYEFAKAKDVSHKAPEAEAETLLPCKVHRKASWTNGSFKQTANRNTESAGSSTLLTESEEVLDLRNSSTHQHENPARQKREISKNGSSMIEYISDLLPPSDPALFIPTDNSCEDSSPIQEEMEVELVSDHQTQKDEIDHSSPKIPIESTSFDAGNSTCADEEKVEDMQADVVIDEECYANDAFEPEGDVNDDQLLEAHPEQGECGSAPETLPEYQTVMGELSPPESKCGDNHEIQHGNSQHQESLDSCTSPPRNDSTASSQVINEVLAKLEREMSIESKDGYSFMAP